MGTAKQRRQQQSLFLEEVRPVVKRISDVLRKFATAASSHLGSDCYLHAALGQALLADCGFEFHRKVGYAAWRVGQGDGDVISHVPNSRSFLPEGTQGLPYHAWLELDDVLIDFTTYQLRHKASELDAADGGHTSVDWCPDFQLLKCNEIHSYRDVAKLNTGMAYYDSIPALEIKLAESFTLDDVDLATARLIMESPDIVVFGPRDIGYPE